jgi:hypothetical protein
MAADWSQPVKLKTASSAKTGSQILVESFMPAI